MIIFLHPRNVCFLLLLPIPLDTMATVCVNFVCKPANEALYYHMTREELFDLDLCVFGARILYHENTFSWEYIKLFVLFIY